MYVQIPIYILKQETRKREHKKLLYPLRWQTENVPIYTKYILRANRRKWFKWSFPGVLSGNLYIKICLLHMYISHVTYACFYYCIFAHNKQDYMWH